MNNITLTGLSAGCFYGTSKDEPSTYTTEDINDLMDAVVGDVVMYSDLEDYPQWFPIVATPAMRKSLDIAYLTACINDMAIEEHIYYLFNDVEWDVEAYINTLAKY